MAFFVPTSVAGFKPAGYSQTTAGKRRFPGKTCPRRFHLTQLGGLIDGALLPPGRHSKRRGKKTAFRPNSPDYLSSAFAPTSSSFFLAASASALLAPSNTGLA